MKARLDSFSTSNIVMALRREAFGIAKMKSPLTTDAGPAGAAV